MQKATEFEVGKVKPGAYLALIFLVLFFSGLLAGHDMLKAFDFNTLTGNFGAVVKGVDGAKGTTFVGSGGFGARAGFLFAFSLIPAVMLALGVIEVMEHYGAIKAAQKLLNPILKPILGVPGLCGLILITDLQSTDAGAAMSKEAREKNYINDKDLIVIAAWQYSGAGMINNFFAIGSALLGQLVCINLIPLVVMFILKFVGAIFVRIVLNTFYRKDFE
ncbi:hypothetical protein AVANS14531_03255 [Campylobacter sp. Cr9]|uniref:nucleoside recognition domain-containing protein n=1 Tax=unclassified Campylobacter TaxID=2593542 RepID=UPI001EFA63AC|nr:nucleoside recognition domain-containing protein [Campylobacter sp. RM5004]MBZ7985354.1 hypothetical protein [Campylobacter sp. Cr9]ULO01074.1 putative membrane protein [Campylobacter sp. RM5004]